MLALQEECTPALQLVTYDIAGGEEPSAARLAVQCTPLAPE